MYKIDYRQAQFLTREDSDETKLIFLCQLALLAGSGKCIQKQTD